MKSLVTILAITILLAGCAGTMDGMIRNSGERITISYQQGMEHDDLTVVMPGGEIFKGKAVMFGKSTSIGWATTTGNTGTAFGVVETYTGNVRAVLFGDRNNTMRCSLQYADSSGFTTSGGIGLCETSDGRVIDVLW